MERRNFFKLVGTASGGLITGACGKTGQELIPLLVAEKEIVPGIEQWHPSVCRECNAGCGTIVRVMEAERKIDVEGETFRQRIAAIKKIEGNPLDPVSGGRLCARGQAAVQSLYHPDRLRGPRKRSGERGSAAFAAVSWDEALAEVAEILSKAAASNPKGIVYLSNGQAGTRSATVGAFLSALGAEPASTDGLGDFNIERRAAEIVFGWKGLPVYEIQDATCVLSLGADFLGGWISPVLYTRRYGHMRQGRPQVRGSLIHAESRFSQTAWSADRWLPVRPGGEQALALAIGHILLAEQRAPGSADLPEAFRRSYESVDVERASQLCGIERRQIERVARDLSEAAAPLVVAGASIIQSNSLAATVAASGLNLLLGNVGKKGGVLPPAPGGVSELEAARPVFRDLAERLEQAEIVLLDGANPVYTSARAAEMLKKAAAVISFSPFVDDSAAYADWILPDHSPLEAAAAVVPETAPGGPSLTGSRAFVQPLYETRATEEVFAELASKMGKPIEVQTPAEAFQRLFEEQKLEADWEGSSEFANYCERQGGWWSERAPLTADVKPEPAGGLQEPVFEGSEQEYPFHFQPYFSLQFGDGRSAHLPWLQETPDPASSAMWGLPVEIDPATAAKLGVANGQMVRVSSPAGQLEAPAYVNPAAIPGVVSMPIGQGHAHYGRYASGRGANPLSIVAGRAEAGTGVPAFGATRVRLEKAGEQRRLVQFSYVDREPHLERL